VAFAAVAGVAPVVDGAVDVGAAELAGDVLDDFDAVVDEPPQAKRSKAAPRVRIDRFTPSPTAAAAGEIA
jgi:hypothetical protein